MIPENAREALRRLHEGKPMFEKPAANKWELRRNAGIVRILKQQGLVERLDSGLPDMTKAKIWRRTIKVPVLTERGRAEL